MRIKKVRGHKRIWRNIEKWKDFNLNLDLDNLKQSERDYVKIWVHPFSALSLTNSFIPEPKKETKNRIINSLFDIYERWKTQLDELNEPYYLKIWFFEPRLSKSQIVCAIGNSIDFYDNTFSYPETIKNFNNNLDKELNKRVENFKWENRLDQEFLFSSDIRSREDYFNEKEYGDDKKWFNDKLKRSHVKTTLKDGTECYVFEIGNVWIGENRK